MSQQTPMVSRLIDNPEFRFRVHETLRNAVFDACQEFIGQRITCEVADAMIRASTDRIISMFPHMQDRRGEIYECVSEIVSEFMYVRCDL